MKSVIGRKRLAAAALGVTFALVAVACSSSSTGASSSGSGAPTTGGTIREESPEFGWTDAFDPTGEYLGTAWGMMDQLLIRGLMTYKHVDAAQGGDTPVPDIATGPPTVSADQLTYDFTLKDNVMWAPPLSRAVTADDVLYAFQRINDKKLVAQYGNYYCGVIKGMDCAAKDDNQAISGITVTDDTHISFTLDQPTGDLLYRLSMPATKPVPDRGPGMLPEPGRLRRGPHLVGPVHDHGPGQAEPLVVQHDQAHLGLQRRQGHDDGAESQLGWRHRRQPCPRTRTGIQIKINSNVDDSFNALENGDLDVVQGTPPVAVLQDFETNPDFQGWLHADQGDRTWYVTMNLLAPPFDDVHVRNAVNLALDKAGIRKAYGGDKRGELATSVEPPTVLPQSQDINPFAANTGAGSQTDAMDEMKQSKYDTNHNGICDDGGACDNILFLGRSTDPWPNMNQVAVASLKPILPGLDLKEVDTSTGYTTLQQVKKLVPISMVPGWGKDYASPYGFDFFIFDSAGIACTAAVNYSLVGMTEAQATECGVKPEYDAYVQN